MLAMAAGSAGAVTTLARKTQSVEPATNASEVTVSALPTRQIRTLKYLWPPLRRFSSRPALKLSRRSEVSPLTLLITSLWATLRTKTTANSLANGTLPTMSSDTSIKWMLYSRRTVFQRLGLPTPAGMVCLNFAQAPKTARTGATSREDSASDPPPRSRSCKSF